MTFPTLRQVFRGAAVLAALIAAPTIARNASAQPFYPQNPLGQFLNGLQVNIARQQAVAEARQAWNTVDPTMYQCLMRTLSPAPPALADRGISPGDPRLQPYFQRCAAAIAQANAQRDATAREAAEEQQRERAAREAQQAEQAREAAEQRAQALAAKEAQQAEEQRRRAEEQAERTAFVQLRTMPELSSYIDRAEPALVFLYVPTSKKLIRGLNGKVSGAGSEQPVVCWAFSTTGASSAGFFLWAMQRLEAATHVRNFGLIPCPGDSTEYGGADVVLFSTTDIMQANAPKALQVSTAIRAGHLSVLLEARQEDYEAKVAADQKQREQAAAEARARAEKIESAIDSGTEPGVAVLAMQAGGDSPLCVIDPLDFDTVKQAVTKSDQQIVTRLSGANEVDHFSADDAFIRVKSGQCALLVGDSTPLRKIRAALKRDGFSAGTGLAWITTADLKAAGDVVAQQRQADEKAKALAQLEAAKKTAEQEAQEKAAAAAAATQRAQAIAKERAATAASSQLLTRHSNRYQSVSV